MARGVKTSIEKYIWKIVYPTGTVRYRVEFAGKGTELYTLEKSLTKAREIKAAHLKKHPELVPRTPAEVREYNIKKARVVKVPGTKFIAEYETRPGTYNIKIARAKEAGGKKIKLNATAVGLANAKRREKELIAEMEKLTGRGIDVIDYKPPNPLYKKALADVKTQMTKYNKLGYYPDDILVKISDKYKFPYVKGEGANRNLSMLVREAGLIDKTKLTSLNPKYIEVVEKWKKYTGDKTKVGVKKALLEEAGLPSKAANVGAFRSVLKNLKIHVPEDIKLPTDQTQRTITQKLGKISALNIESFLSGQKLGPLVVTGKIGSLVDKMHLAEKRGLVTVGEMGYGSAKLNQMLGGGFKRAEGAERHRTALNNHIDRIIKKHKGNPNAMYTIGKGPDSFDQRKFKNSLQKIFGKTQGTVPLSKYIDQIINTEVQLMGYATDGIITTRRVDPITLERMVPPSNLSGSRTLPTFGKIKDVTTLQELGLEKKIAGRGKITPRLGDFGESAGLAFESAKINIANFKNKITPYQMKSIVNSIDKMLGEGLLDRATLGKYETISTLAKQCRLLRAKGGRVDFATGGPCVDAKRAIQTLDDADFIKVGAGIEEGATGVLGKIRNAAKGFLGALGKVGVKAAPWAALAVAGAAIEPLVKPFMNDDPSTYLTDPDQQAGMLEALIEGETPKVDQEILNWQYPGLAAATAAGAIPGARETYLDRLTGRGPAGPAGTRLPATIPNKPVGKLRSALGFKGVLGKALGATFSPLAVAATLPIHVAAQRRGGTEWGDIATDPMNWMAPAFASSGAEFATKGMKQTGILAKAIRMGISRPVLNLISRRFGLPGLMISGGMWGYDKWKNRSINDED